MTDCIKGYKGKSREKKVWCGDGKEGTGWRGNRGTEKEQMEATDGERKRDV